MNWNGILRQAHRWLSVAFTLAVIANIAALIMKRQELLIGLTALFPLALLLVSGLYLFLLPHAARWRGRAKSSS